VINSGISGLGVLRRLQGASFTKSDSVDAELPMEEASLVSSCGLPPPLLVLLEQTEVRDAPRGRLLCCLGVGAQIRQCLQETKPKPNSTKLNQIQ
jgi:hypothetical protein